MRELKVVGLDVDGQRIICETAESSEKFILRPDDRLRAALSGERAAAMPTPVDVEVPNVLTPKEIQARIRAGASVEQVAGAAGVDVARVERFAHPVLLERSRAAELATASHPVLVDGPAVLTLLETVTTALVGRGLDPDATSWDAWRNEDGRWTVQLSWKAGRSDNVAHFRFVPGAHGGTATAFDDAAAELIDPHFDRPRCGRWRRCRPWTCRCPSLPRHPSRSLPLPLPQRQLRPKPLRPPRPSPGPASASPRFPAGRTSCWAFAPALSPSR